MSEYTLKDLDQEISRIADSMARPLPKEWLVNAVIREHRDIQGEDSDMALCCMHDTVTRSTEKYFRKFKQSTDELNQLKFEGHGYQHLQTQYVFKRDGESVCDYVWQMSEKEILAKIEEHEAMGKGHYEHAEELRRYLQEREQAG